MQAPPVVQAGQGSRPGHRCPFHVPRPRRRQQHVLVSHGCPRTPAVGRRPLRTFQRFHSRRSHMKLHTLAANFVTLIQEFFCLHLVQQKDASSQTVASYRDTFRLLLGYIQRTRRKQPSALTLADLDAPTITAFLQHLEKKRGNKAQTRNVRFAAIRSFMKFAAARDPASLPIIQRVLAIPLKRFPRSALHYLSRDEVTAIIEAPDVS